MLRQQNVVERLRQIAKEGDFPRGTIIGSGRALVEIELQDCDRYSALVEEIRAGARFLDVTAAARALSERLLELDQQLALLEYDSDEGLAIMRGAQPLREPGAVEYWEARLQPGSVQLARYRKEHSAADRTRVAVPMLHRGLGLLVEQLAGALLEIDERD